MSVYIKNSLLADSQAYNQCIEPEKQTLKTNGLLPSEQHTTNNSFVNNKPCIKLLLQMLSEASWHIPAGVLKTGTINITF